MPYKNTKVKVCSPDGDTDYFEIVTGVPQGDTLAPYLIMISIDYVLRTSIDVMKENGNKIAKERRSYLTHTITNTHYADNSSSSKYTGPSRIPTILSGTRS